MRQKATDTTMVALGYYNKKYRTNYQLVDPGSSNSFLGDCGQLWFHCNFTAKPKTFVSSQETFFFAEMKVDGSQYDKLLVIACRPFGEMFKFYILSSFKYQRSNILRIFHLLNEHSG